MYRSAEGRSQAFVAPDGELKDRDGARFGSEWAFSGREVASADSADLISRDVGGNWRCRWAISGVGWGICGVRTPNTR